MVFFINTSTESQQDGCALYENGIHRVVILFSDTNYSLFKTISLPTIENY
jgi:hypothetical protein